VQCGDNCCPKGNTCGANNSCVPPMMQCRGNQVQCGDNCCPKGNSCGPGNVCVPPAPGGPALFFPAPF
jgi:hypothetical protein